MPTTAATLQDVGPVFNTRVSHDETPTYDAIPINDVPMHVPGRRVHRATPWRWCLHGIIRDGVVVKLPSFKVAGRRYTTRAGIAQFLALCNDTSAPSATDGSLFSRAAEAGQMLESRGVR